jgi:sugar lactone lactonase YvrE
LTPVHDHREILALAATAIDFELDPDERKRLDDALEACSLCRRQASAMRATATVLQRPLDIGTPSRVRDVVVAAALGRGRRAPALRSILVAGLSILVVLGGTAVFVGSRGLGILPPPSPAPSTVAQASTPASPSPSGHDASSARSSTQPASPSPGRDNALRSGDIAAMVTDGRLVIRTLPETGPNSALFKTRLYPGQRVLVLEGPVDGDGYPWYRIRLGVIEGWVAAASLGGEPWLVPVGNGPIAFVRDAVDGSGEAIYAIDASGTTGESVLFDDPSLAGYRGLTWSPDGRRLAFVATPAGSVNGSTEVYTVDADGSNLVRISQNDVDDDSPAWSPDGTRLAFRVAGADPSARVDSNVAITLVGQPDVTVLGPGASPVWSPDGQQIAMTVTEGDVSHVWIQGVDGGGRRQASDIAVAAAPPSWSPDGQSLVVVSSAGLSLIQVASGSVTPLTADPASTATWSIGGTIAFSATGSGSPGLFVMDSDGTGLRQVLADQGFAAVAAWSPDGRWLLLGDEHTGSPVTLVDAGSGNLVVVGAADGITRSAAWRPLLP